MKVNNMLKYKELFVLNYRLITNWLLNDNGL